VRSDALAESERPTRRRSPASLPAPYSGVLRSPLLEEWESVHPYYTILTTLSSVPPLRCAM